MYPRRRYRAINGEHRAGYLEYNLLRCLSSWRADMIIARMSLIALLGFSLQTAHAQESVSPIPNDIRERLLELLDQSPTQFPGQSGDQARTRTCKSKGPGSWTAGNMECSCTLQQCYKNCRVVLIDGVERTVCEKDGEPECEKGTGTCTIKF
jgi:hypothetical protein